MAKRAEGGTTATEEVRRAAKGGKKVDKTAAAAAACELRKAFGLEAGQEAGAGKEWETGAPSADDEAAGPYLVYDGGKGTTARGGQARWWRRSGVDDA